MLTTLRGQAPPPPATDGWRAPIAAAFDQIAEHAIVAAQERARVGWLDLLGRRLTDRLPDPTAKVEISILTRTAERGESVKLHVRAFDDGPPGLYPHPTMALFSCDATFRESVVNAWRAAGPSPGVCFTWELKRDDHAIDHLTDGSASAAFAVALVHVSRTLAHRRSRLLRLHSAATVSAVIAPDGTLGGVEGLDKKFEGAVTAGLKRVVLSKDDWEANGGGGTDLDLRPAADLDAAVKEMRRPLPAVVGLVALLLLVAVSTTALLAITDHRNSIRHERERISRLGDELLTKAGKTDVTDLQLRQRLQLAAVSLGKTARNKVLVTRALATSDALKPGVLRTTRLPLAAPPYGMLSVDQGNGVLVWADSGHLALLDTTTNEIRGTYVEAPGSASLTQPVPTAVTTLAKTALAAVVFQRPIRLQGVPHAATLVVFSTAGKLRPIATVRNFTDDPTTAVGYSPSGTRLVTVSGSDVTVWDATSAEPSRLSTCRWRPQAAGARGRAVEVVALDNHRPGLVLDRGQVVELRSWERTTSARCPGQLVASPLAGVSARDFANTTVTTGTNTRDRLVEVGVRKDGRLVTRRIGGTPKIIDLGARAVEVGPIVSAEVAVELALDRGRGTALRRFDVVGAALRFPVTYKHQALPALSANGKTYATHGHDVTKLSGQGMAFPAPAVQLGHAGGIVDGVAISAKAVGIAYPTGPAVFGLRDPKLDRVATWPPERALAGGDGRFNETFSLSGSGRYVAAILNKDHDHRALHLYDMANHATLDVQAQLHRFTTLAPLDVAFVPGTDRLLVEYLNGLLLELRPRSRGWAAQATLRGQVRMQAYSLSVADDRLYRIEAKDGHSRVVKYDLSGKQQATWSLAPTGLTFGLIGDNPVVAQLGVMDRDRAALILGSGTAFKLLDGGRLGPPIPMDDGPVLASVQIADDDLLITRQRGTSTLHWSAGIAETSTSEHGLINVPAVSPTRDLLVGSVFLASSVMAQPLEDDNRLALRCATADGDLSRSAWRHYVGPREKYRPLCSAVQSRKFALAAVIKRSYRLPNPVGVATPTSAAELAHGRACRKRRAKLLGWVRVGDGVYVCAHGRPIWTTAPMTRPTVSSGGSAGDPLLLVQGKPRANPDGPTFSDLIRADGTVVKEFITTGGAASITGRRLSVTERVGDLLATTTFALNRDGEWSAVEQVPVGSAVPSAE